MGGPRRRAQRAGDAGTLGRAAGAKNRRCILLPMVVGSWSRCRALAARIAAIRARASRIAGIAALAGVALVLMPALAAAAQPVELAAPYEYLGWGDPQPPDQRDGRHRHAGPDARVHPRPPRRANPEWDGERPLLGGSDQAAIESIRAAGGEVDVSFGGWSGKKLGSACKSPADARRRLPEGDRRLLAEGDRHRHRAQRVHQQEGAQTRDRSARDRAGARTPASRSRSPSGPPKTGPEPDGISLIARRGRDRLSAERWTIMPFDFGAPLTDMGHASIRALEGLAARPRLRIRDLARRPPTNTRASPR